MDNDVINLAKAMRKVESDNDFAAKGKSGEYGAYQWMPDTWKAHAREALGDENAPMTPQNQNAVAYTIIKKRKDAGLNPAEIAAEWNSGSSKGWENKISTGYGGKLPPNSAGVEFNVPLYVKKVTDTYREMKGQSAVGGTYAPAPQQEPVAREPMNLLENPNKVENPIEEFGKGAAKGITQEIVGASQLGNTIANQTAGRVVSAIQGEGFRPRTQEELGGGIAIAGSPEAQALDEKLKSENAFQTAGKIGAGVAGLLVPGGATAKSISNANRLARVADDALEIVAPKETAKVIREAIKQGRTKVSGFFRNIEMTPDQRTERAAQAIEDLVRSGKMSTKKTVAENSVVVDDEIGKTAKDLVKQLKEQEINLILTPGELRGLMTRAQNAIGENPTMVGNAGESANRIFQKFVSFLPKGRDIDASDLLDARKKLDSWMRSIKGDRAFDPATENALSIALRAVRQEANDLIARKAPDVAVKELLSKQSALYDALENMAAKGVKEIGTNAPARFLQRHPIIKHALIGALPSGLAGGYIANKLTGN